MATHQHTQNDDELHAEHLVKDPVCGMSVDPQSAEHRSTHEEKTQYFCSSRCQSRFEEDPEKFLSGKHRSETSSTPGAMFTCPMHPEIRQQGPGDCPICGMGLEPEEIGRASCRERV